MQGAKRELYATLLLSNFQVHRHIKATPRLLHTFARPAALVRTHEHDVYANRLNPVNSGGAVDAHETSRWRCRHAVSYIFQLESRGDCLVYISTLPPPPRSPIDCHALSRRDGRAADEVSTLLYASTHRPTTPPARLLHVFAEFSIGNESKVK